MERAAATTLKGNPLTLIGPELKAGDAAPDFNLVDKGLKPVTLKDTGNHVRIFSVVPSLDTPVCDAQTKKFNEAAAQLPDVDIYTVSMDLPFAQSRWCGAFGVDRIKMLSDHRGTAHRKPRHFRGGPREPHPPRRVCQGSGRLPQLRSRAGGGPCLFGGHGLSSADDRFLSSAFLLLRLRWISPNHLPHRPPNAFSRAPWEVRWCGAG